MLVVHGLILCICSVVHYIFHVIQCDMWSSLFAALSCHKIILSASFSPQASLPILSSLIFFSLMGACFGSSFCGVS